MPAAAFYISGHGFGHASRQIEILNALGPARPDTAIHVRTSAPRWLFDRTARTPLQWSECDCDTGIVQIDSLTLDEAATASRAADFYATFADRVRRESAFLADAHIGLVVSDAPPLACAAAARASIPSVVIGNFTWDWIYAGYGERFREAAPDVIPLIGDAYSLARGAWRLPMHGGFETVGRVVDLPFVARHTRFERRDVLSGLGIAGDRPIALSSFGGYGFRGFDPRTLDCAGRWTIVITGRTPPTDLPAGAVFVEEAQIYARGFRYEDLVAASDVVVTKPGYGIIAECIANETGVLYTSRGRFVEYDVLVREMPRFLRCGHIDRESLLAGRWSDALDAVLAAPAPPERPRTDGSEVAAGMIAAALADG